MSKNSERPTLPEPVLPAASSGDCTGLIPSGGNLTEDELDDYMSLYPFTAADKGKNPQ